VLVLLLVLELFFLLEDFDFDFNFDFVIADVIVDVVDVVGTHTVPAFSGATSFIIFASEQAFQ
jgi:hypothetical protein